MDASNALEACPLCEGRQTKVFFQSALNVSVRSNSLPLNLGVRVLECGACGHLFKPREMTKAASDYENYPAMDNSPAQDKLDYSSEYPTHRSQIILNYLSSLGLVQQASGVLDFGCHRGAFLRLLDQGAHAGYDLSQDYQSNIEQMGYEFFRPKKNPIQGTFDLVTMIHVFEHLLDVERDIQPGLQALSPKGHLLIQVPYTHCQPTDLYILDHRHHFSAQTLASMMRKLGMSRFVKEQVLIPGELTGIYQLIGAGPEAISLEPEPFDISTKHQPKVWVRGLVQGEQQLQQLKQSGDLYWIYGAGNLGALIAQYLGQQALGFIDDNLDRQSRSFLGLPVRALDAVPVNQGRILIAVPEAGIARVVARCKVGKHAFNAPFDLQLPNLQQMKESVRLS